MIVSTTFRRVLFSAATAGVLVLPASAAEPDQLTSEIWEHGGEPCIDTIARFQHGWDHSFAYAVRNPKLHCALLEAMEIMEFVLRGNKYEEERKGAYQALVRMCLRMLRNPSPECKSRE